MNLYDKIDEIRRKPEHIRMRYVWVCVSISMVFVLAVWALSIKSRSYQYRMEVPGQVAGEASIFDELKTQKESLNEYQQQMGNIKETLETGLQSAQNQQVQQDQQGQPGNSSPTGALTEAEMKEDLLNYGNMQNTVPNTVPTSNPASLFQ